MNTHLKLVSDNQSPVPRGRPDARTLHQLADKLTEEVQAGHYEVARVLASFYELSPFGIAIIATWMTKAGLSEVDILKVVL